MIRSKIENTNPPIVDLTGLDGNAFALLGMARRWARDLQLDYNSICDEAMAGDYEHLLSVMDKNFGDYVIFER
jgi:hypothetical protein